VLGERACGIIAAVDPDLDFLRRWQAGDKRAGEDLFHRHFADILRFFENKVWSKAEDLTQQTFVECVASRDRFRGESTFRTFLFAIAWNQLRHHFRRELKEENLDFEVSSLSDLVASTTSPSGKLDRHRRHRQIHDALARLPLSQQTLLELHYWQGLDAAALAEVFGVAAGSIRVRLLRARNALRAQLEHAAAGESPADEVDDPLATSLLALEAEDRRGP
jgi:RNA polymerase sigma factor (sigma-70 family)